MSGATDRLVASLQRTLATAEVERLQFVGELEEMRLRAEQAEARIASVSGVTREELVRAEREACAALVEHMDPTGKQLRGLADAIRARGGQ